jgi:hypothetical protein
MNIFTHFAQYYGNDYMTHSGSPQSFGTFLTIMFISLAIFVVLYVITALVLGRIFTKAGIPSWVAWVPIYNTYKLMEMGDQKGFWAILLLVPFVNYVAIVFLYIAMYRIGLKFGKQGWFVVLAIFLPYVWYIWLAVDDSTWHAKPVQI